MTYPALLNKMVELLKVWRVHPAIDIDGVTWFPLYISFRMDIELYIENHYVENVDYLYSRNTYLTTQSQSNPNFVKYVVSEQLKTILLLKFN